MKTEARPLTALLVLIGVGLLYVIFLHHWYWYEGALIDLNQGCEVTVATKKCWHDQDIFSHFFFGVLFIKGFAPVWNAFMSNEGARLAFAGLVVILYIASAVAVITQFLRSRQG
jgi:hypothetical protein